MRRKTFTSAFQAENISSQLVKKLNKKTDATYVISWGLLDNCSIYNIPCKVLGVKRYVGGVIGGGRNPAFLDQILI